MPAPHDNAYKHLFSHPQAVRDLLRGFVHEDWVAMLDYDSLEKVNGSSVSDDPRSRQDEPSPASLAAYRPRLRYFLLDERRLSEASLDAPDNARLLEVSRRVFGLVDAVPSRLTAFGFAVVGNFEEAINGWRRDARLWQQPNEGIILAAAAGGKTSYFEDVLTIEIDSSAPVQETATTAAATDGIRKLGSY